MGKGRGLHTPENCKDENLKALCPRYHNSYDAKEISRGTRLRKRAAMNIEPLRLLKNPNLSP